MRVDGPYTPAGVPEARGRGGGGGPSERSVPFKLNRGSGPAPAQIRENDSVRNGEGFRMEDVGGPVPGPSFDPLPPLRIFNEIFNPTLNRET